LPVSWALALLAYHIYRPADSQGFTGKQRYEQIPGTLHGPPGKLTQAGTLQKMWDVVLDQHTPYPDGFRFFYSPPGKRRTVPQTGGRWIPST